MNPDQLKKSIEYYSANPTDPKAGEFKRRLKEGNYDSVLPQTGYTRTNDGIYKSAEQASTISNRLSSDFIGQETLQDLGGVITDIAESSGKRADNIMELKEKRKAGERSLIGTTLKQVGQLAGAGADAIGAVTEGVVKTVLPQKVEEQLKEVVMNFGEDIVENPAVQNAINWYSRQDEKTQEALDAVGGVASLVTEFLGAGTVKGGLNVAGKGVQKAIDVGSDVVTDATGKVIKTGTKVASELQGALTGTSGETLDTAFNVVRQGGRQAEDFTKALRKEITPEQLAENAQNAVATVSREQQLAYKTAFEPIKSQVIDTSGIRKSFIDEIGNANIKVKNGVLDFSESKLRTTPQAQTKLQSAFDEINRFGDSATLEQVDTSRQALKGLRLSGDDASANLANKFIDDATRVVRQTGEKVEGYKGLLDEFAEQADFIQQLERDLMTGNRKTIDQTYRRITTSLKTNNEQRMKLLQSLDDATGGTLLAQIAGQQLSEELPRGIIRAFAASLAGAGIATGASGLGVGALIPLLLASPRVSGEFIRALGLTAKKADVMIDAIKTAQKTLSQTYNVPVKDLSTLFIIGTPEVVTDSGRE
jgi:hypothetical protein